MEAKSPTYWPYLLAILALWAFVSSMEYTEQRMNECEGKRMEYNPETDLCVVTQQENPQPEPRKVTKNGKTKAH